MSSRKKSQYFRIMQAKKRKLEGSEKSVITEPSSKGQKSISVFFSAKPKPPKPKPERSVETEAGLKRKLNMFKSCENDKPCEVRQCNKKVKMDQEVNEFTFESNGKSGDRSHEEIENN